MGSQNLLAGPVIGVPDADHGVIPPTDQFLTGHLQ